MKKEYRFLLVFVVIFAIALLCLILPHWTWDLPIFIPLGAIGIGFWLFMEGITEICRGRTEHIIYNRGHMSVREKDIIKIPYHETATTKGGADPLLGDIVVACLNGFDFWGFTMPGNKSDPVLIYPGICHEKEENNYHSHANMTKYKFRELPEYVRRKLALYPNRIDPLHTPILYGVTSHFNGNATTENLKIESKERELNDELSAKDKVIERLLKQIRDEKDANKQQFILGNIIKPKDEERE